MGGESSFFSHTCGLRELELFNHPWRAKWKRPYTASQVPSCLGEELLGQTQGLPWAPYCGGKHKGHIPCFAPTYRRTVRPMGLSWKILSRKGRRLGWRYSTGFFFPQIGALIDDENLLRFILEIEVGVPVCIHDGRTDFHSCICVHS